MLVRRYTFVLRSNVCACLPTFYDVQTLKCMYIRLISFNWDKHRGRLNYLNTAHNSYVRLIQRPSHNAVSATYSFIYGNFDVKHTVAVAPIISFRKITIDKLKENNCIWQYTYIKDFRKNQWKRICFVIKFIKNLLINGVS